jgi:hypothetical protein
MYRLKNVTTDRWMEKQGEYYISPPLEHQFITIITSRLLVNIFLHKLCSRLEIVKKKKKFLINVQIHLPYLLTTFQPFLSTSSEQELNLPHKKRLM